MKTFMGNLLSYTRTTRQIREEESKGMSFLRGPTTRALCLYNFVVQMVSLMLERFFDLRMIEVKGPEQSRLRASPQSISSWEVVL
jgi:hypothetical protein